MVDEIILYYDAQSKKHQITHQCLYSVFQSASRSAFKSKRCGSTAKQN